MDQPGDSHHAGVHPTDQTGPIATPTAAARRPTLPPQLSGFTPIYDELRAELTAAGGHPPRPDDPGERDPNLTEPNPAGPNPTGPDPAGPAADGELGALTRQPGGPDGLRQEP
jgi:hypothetical protein